MSSLRDVVRVPGGDTRHVLGEIGRGGESVIHKTDDPAMVVKLWEPGVERDATALEELVRRLGAGWPAPSGHRRLVVPQAVLAESRDELAGVVLERLPLAAVELSELLTPPDRARLGLEVSPTWRLRVAARIADVAARAHQHDLLLGDLSPRNFALLPERARVVAFDADAWQPADGPVRRRRIAEDVRAPEHVGVADATPTFEADRWSLAITLALVLLDGRHPFDGARQGEPGATFVEDNVRAGYSHLVAPRLLASPGAPSIEDLPAALRPLAKAAFGAGHGDPGRRPAAAKWVSALAAEAGR
jgi:DNA-binding helix-hairpin-helix protein with protein kinase domain